MLDRRTGALSLIAGLCAFYIPTAVATDGTTNVGGWKVEPLDYAIRGSDKIGTLKAGFVCLPSGILKWGDIRLPRDSDLEKKALLQIAIFEQKQALSSATVYQLKGRLDKFDLKLCVAGLGIGEKKPKGRGRIEVKWTQLQWPEGNVMKSETISSEFDVDGTDPRKDSEPLQEALVDSLAKFLKSNAPQ